LRWYSGIILNGLCGAALMGGAVYVALDGEAFFAAMPERAGAVRNPANTAERSQSVIRKTDRLASISETSTARQVMRLATTVRQGEREVVRIRPVVRVSTNLSLTTSELSASIPPFNAARLLAGTSESTQTASATTNEEAPAEDAEVSFVTRELGPMLQRAKVAGTASLDEITMRVREAANWIGTRGGPSLANAATGTGKLAYAVEGSPDPYAGFETRIVPENITLLPKTANQADGGNGGPERTILVKRGETVTTILRDLGASADDTKKIAEALGPRGRDGGLKEGQKLRVLLATSGASGRMQPLRVIVTSDAGPEAAIALSDIGKYVSVEVQSAETQVAQQPESDDDDDDAGAVRLYKSLYETALRQQVPRAVIDELIRIYSYDVDFQRRVQAGDSFEVLFPGEEDAPGEARGDVMFASLTINGETKKYYRFVTPDDSVVDYYDESGKSAKKFLVRKPVGAGLMRSGYGWRRHPILGYSKMHTGVDWAAPRGTPIYASGAGIVDKVGWEGGYGKYVRLKHAYGYETAYGHMSAFARGIQPGSRVRQGQVIGYVGSTGLSTGAHVHYEILVNGRFVDPNRIKLPRGRSLEGPVLASFEQERDRFETMMNRNGGRVTDLVPASGKARKEAAANR
jgi:murein DD-endopeptidase MepM/ murein hydrolase activator NlpD